MPMTIATVSSRAIRQPVFVVRQVPAGPRLLRRFRRFIETTDWERRYCCHRWIDGACLAVILLSAFYFAPIAVSLVWR